MAKKKVKEERNKHCCQYAYCPMPNDLLPLNGKDVVSPRNDGKKYHKVCYENSLAIRRVKDTWKLRQPDFTDWKKLTTVVGSLIRAGYDADYILFAVKEGFRLEILNYPPGIRYLVQDENIAKAYKERKSRKNLKNIKFEAPTEEINSGSDFEFNDNDTMNFYQIFGGK